MANQGDDIRIKLSMKQAEAESDVDIVIDHIGDYGHHLLHEHNKYTLKSL